MWLKFDGKCAYIKLDDTKDKNSIIELDDFTIDMWVHIIVDKDNVYVNGKQLKRREQNVILGSGNSRTNKETKRRRGKTRRVNSTTKDCSSKG